MFCCFSDLDASVCVLVWPVSLLISLLLYNVHNLSDFVSVFIPIFLSIFYIVRLLLQKDNFNTEQCPMFMR